MNDVAIVIPVYNEEKVIAEVINQLVKTFPNVICVNDGSRDHSADEIFKTKAMLVNHPINLGQGAAIQTGLEAVLLNKNINYFVTFDADGQHRLEDANAMVKHMKKHKDLDVLLGSRFINNTSNLSSSKKLLLKLATRFMNRSSGLKLTDTHNGLKVFNRNFATNLKLTMPDMAHASEIIHRIADGKYKYEEYPVTIEYTDYSRSKGQASINAINISFDLILNRIINK